MSKSFLPRPRRHDLLSPAACLAAVAFLGTLDSLAQAADSPRTRVSINSDWRFTKGDPPGNEATNLVYDVRPAGRGAAPATNSGPVAKPWILPTANAFLKGPSQARSRPEANLGNGVPFIATTFDDASWRKVDLPHDYAIEGPFITTGGGGMGRLPTAGVVWYRKNLSIPAAAAGKSLFLDFDGAMSYSEVWLNGQFVGGWPYGYSSFRLNLTPYAKPGVNNVLAVRLENLPNSSRWYPGAGLYRNIWLVETAPVHVDQWGTFITTPEVSPQSASVVLKVTVDNDSKQAAAVQVATRIFELDANDQKAGSPVAALAPRDLEVPSGKNASVETKGAIANPKLWGTGKNQKPNRYVAVTTIQQNGQTVDSYETPFGVRTLKYDPHAGFFLNGEHIKLNGVCNHHDLGALGAAVNYRALQRQLEILAEMGCNAIRTSHNPPAPELLDLCDKMGFLVMDEPFDCWVRSKTANDYALVYADWHEPDLRAMLRRDRNHPSVIMWSIGNEVGEQTGGTNGAAIAQELTEICHEEDPTRPTISAMNSARANSPFTGPIDLVGLNYQGAGLRAANPQYPVFHQAYPEKVVLGSETVDAYSSRGYYTFGGGGRGAGGAGAVHQVSSYDLEHAGWSYIPEVEFAAQDRYPFVAGEFVWTGFDYLGEPDPYSAFARSSYSGILDLAGLKKDRFYFYQSVWRPDLPMAHILPHWTWPERVADSQADPPKPAQVTPVHVYTSGDEAELFLNGQSQGRKKKGEGEYRLRWDDVTYHPGELKVVAYKNGKEWATDTVKTAGEANKLLLSADRSAIAADGKDLSYITLTVADKNSQMVPRATNEIRFELTGPGEIVATDNGDPTDMTVFPSKARKAFNGLALAIVRARPGQPGSLVITARSEGLAEAQVTVTAR